jgi:hypothetical protein
VSLVERRPLTRSRARWWLALGIAFVLALSLTGLAWRRAEARTEGPAILTAKHYLTLELHLGASSSRDLGALYQPFRAIVAPRSQAADLTHWLIGATAAAPPGLRLAHAAWRLRRPVVVSTRGRSLTVEISYFWTRVFRSQGRTGGMATIRVTLVRHHRRYRITAVGWDMTPSVSAAIDRTSFAYDLDWIRSLPTPPMGMPPPLKPRVNNP